jgi:hypothetical protein
MFFKESSFIGRVLLEGVLAQKINFFCTEQDIFEGDPAWNMIFA